MIQNNLKLQEYGLYMKENKKEKIFFLNGKYYEKVEEIEDEVSLICCLTLKKNRMGLSFKKKKNITV